MFTGFCAAALRVQVLARVCRNGIVSSAHRPDIPARTMFFFFFASCSIRQMSRGQFPNSPGAAGRDNGTKERVGPRVFLLPPSPPPATPHTAPQLSQQRSVLLPQLRRRGSPDIHTPTCTRAWVASDIRKHTHIHP